MPTYRIYIDESGDHRYRATQDPDGRFLALTAVVIEDQHYKQEVAPSLEALKRRHFSYDPDTPVILTRSLIVKRKRWFGVLANPERRQAWSDAIIAYYAGSPAQMFTVVIDKQEHRRKYPQDTFDPYEYSIEGNNLVDSVGGVWDHSHAEGAKRDYRHPNHPDRSRPILRRPRRVQHLHG